VHHIEALIDHPGGESFGKRWGRIAHVVSDNDALRVFLAHRPGERSTHILDELGVDLIIDHTADVISLDHRVHVIGRAGDCHNDHPSAPGDGAYTLPGVAAFRRLPTQLGGSGRTRRWPRRPVRAVRCDGDA